ncbi:hypothetical protein SAMN05660666_02533 [Novosphingobium aromaticivorans]|uniref:hypothetical protein n=1 Tax=Novosphingobium aromaticivorans TaxID=48935 RepID=UPI0002F63604|nr:hypothetical protein [Novosphingobium aromaticivorans]SCY69779.1 hypothetical protein SAMN05660666_02533 [Novosphingobium aromaticivorans]
MSDTGINLTAIMEREGITDVHHFKALGLFSVTLKTGQVGSGKTVGEALSKAKQDMTFAKYARAA